MFSLSLCLSVSLSLSTVFLVCGHVTGANLFHRLRGPLQHAGFFQRTRWSPLSTLRVHSLSTLLTRCVMSAMYSSNCMTCMKCVVCRQRYGQVQAGGRAGELSGPHALYRRCTGGLLSIRKRRKPHLTITHIYTHTTFLSSFSCRSWLSSWIHVWHTSLTVCSPVFWIWCLGELRRVGNVRGQQHLRKNLPQDTAFLVEYFSFIMTSLCLFPFLFRLCGHAFVLVSQWYLHIPFLSTRYGRTSCCCYNPFKLTRRESSPVRASLHLEAGVAVIYPWTRTTETSLTPVTAPSILGILTAGAKSCWSWCWTLRWRWCLWLYPTWIQSWTSKGLCSARPSCMYFLVYFTCPL